MHLLMNDSCVCSLQSLTGRLLYRCFTVLHLRKCIVKHRRSDLVENGRKSKRIGDKGLSKRDYYQSREGRDREREREEDVGSRMQERKVKSLSW